MILTLLLLWQDLVCQQVHFPAAVESMPLLPAYNSKHPIQECVLAALFYHIQHSLEHFNVERLGLGATWENGQWNQLRISL